MSDSTVLVTGFGPFGEHKINASWQAVQLLPSYQVNNANIVIEEVPVIYNIVDTLVPSLWKKYKPVLVVHVGVSSEARKVTIEKQAFRTGYFKTDCIGTQHNTNEACSSSQGEDCLKTGINVTKICENINGCTDYKTCVSGNAGRYLCEYIYYKSLSIDTQRTLFIHVPPLNNPYTADELAEVLLKIITCALEQLNNLF